MNEPLSAAQAARVLGCTVPTVHTYIRSGRLMSLTSGSGPVRIAADDVNHLLRVRRDEAARRIGDPVAYARKTLAAIWPNRDGMGPEAALAARTGRDALDAVPVDAPALFGRPALEAVAARPQLRRAGGCAWCWASADADVRGGLHPVNSEAFRLLLGEPCARDRDQWEANKATLRKLKGEVDALKVQMSQTRADDRLRAAKARKEHADREYAAATIAARKAGSLTASGGDLSEARRLKSAAYAAKARGDERRFVELMTQAALSLGVQP